MKEEVELKKEDIRNMTMIFNSPEMLMNLSMQNGHNMDPNALRDSQNILDELEDNNPNSNPQGEE